MTNKLQEALDASYLRTKSSTYFRSAVGSGVLGGAWGGYKALDTGANIPEEVGRNAALSGLLGAGLYGVAKRLSPLAVLPGALLSAHLIQKRIKERKEQPEF